MVDADMDFGEWSASTILFWVLDEALSSGICEHFGEFVGAALDIGGSTTKCAIADGAANLLRCFSFPTSGETLASLLMWASASGIKFRGVTGGGAKLYAALMKDSPSCGIECVAVGEMDSIGAGVAALGLEAALPCPPDPESDMRGVPRHCDHTDQPGDLVVAMIGSGTSIVRVAAPHLYSATPARRITGTPFGGATFRGLASHLAGGETDPSVLVAMAASVPERGRSVRIPYGDPSYSRQLWTIGVPGVTEGDLASIDAINPWEWHTVYDSLAPSI